MTGLTDYGLVQVLREARNLYFHRQHLEVPLCLYLLAVCARAGLLEEIEGPFRVIREAVEKVKEVTAANDGSIFEGPAQQRAEEVRRRAERLTKLRGALEIGRSDGRLIQSIEWLAEAQRHGLARLPVAVLRQVARRAEPSHWEAVQRRVPGVATFLAWDRLIPAKEIPCLGYFHQETLAECKQQLDASENDVAVCLYLAAELGKGLDRAAEEWEPLWFERMDEKVEWSRFEAGRSVHRLLGKIQDRAAPGVMGLMLLLLRTVRSGQPLDDLIRILKRETSMNPEVAAVASYVGLSYKRVAPLLGRFGLERAG